FALVKSNQFDQAENGFKAFLAAYPDHVLAGNAKYWLGETYYVRGSFEQAARMFAEGYQQFPQGAKAADNLLKLGLSLSAMGKAEDACIALAQIQKEGFKGVGPVLRRAEQESAKLGCS
ncbi:MAG: tol-pal system protein YbgF, partial [Bdellovibrionales bacterium]